MSAVRRPFPRLTTKIFASFKHMATTLPSLVCYQEIYHQNMDMVRRNNRKKRNKRQGRVSEEASSKYIDIIARRKKRRKIRKLAERVLCPFVNDCPQQLVLLPQTGTNGINSCKDIMEQTLDLVSDDSNCSDDFVEDLDSDSSVISLTVEEDKDRNVIDLCKELPGQEEVIDLTDTSIQSVSDKEVENIKPTVIELSEDEPNEPGSDEILVIGTYSKTPNPDLPKREKPRKSFSFIPLPGTSKLINIRKKLKKKYLKKKLKLDRHKDNHKRKRERRDSYLMPREQVARVGGNIYVNSPVSLPSTGLRPIIIDGSNVAFVHSECHFSCKRLEICINYFKEKGHKVTAFVPQFRTLSNRSDNPQLLRKLERQGDVILTPSKRVDGKAIVPYDDRFIVQTAVIKGGVIISRDNYNDLLKENPAWAETIKYRTLAFTWVDDVLMFPKDPLGVFGPTLEEFLRFN